METQRIGNNESIIPKSPYYYLSKYRLQLMGFAILWVVWFHSSVFFDFLPVAILNNFFAFIKDIGYGGVDIFLLVSGMGIYNSLSKNNIPQFLRNRLKRITPTWLLSLIISVFLGRFIFQIYFSKLEIIGYATFTGFWLNMSNQGNWYVYAIMLFYLISPFFYYLLKNNKHRFGTCLIMVLIALILSTLFLGNEKLMVFSRVPIYIIGMYTSSSLKNLVLRKKHWIGLLLSFIAGISVLWLCYKFLRDFLWIYGLWWYPFIVIAPTLSLLIAKCMDCLQKAIKPLMFLLAVFGKSSLEILLVSDFLFANFNKLNIVFFNNWLTSIFIVVTSLLIGIVFHYLVDSIIKLFETRILRKGNSN